MLKCSVSNMPTHNKTSKRLWKSFQFKKLKLIKPLSLFTLFSLLFFLILTLLSQGLSASFSNYAKAYSPSSSNFLNLTILNPHAHPSTNEDWIVSFETTGTADLTITPKDQATIDDLDFISLACGDKKTSPQF